MKVGCLLFEVGFKLLQNPIEFCNRQPHHGEIIALNALNQQRAFSLNAVCSGFGEPFDKAGAYGVQDRACAFVSGIEGDFYNVMGLPVCKITEKLKEMSVL